MEKPSLALIPTGYKDGKLYSVLPENGVGDFDVVRGSGATRVNKEGLVEDVRILSGELVTQPVNLVTDFTANGGGVIVDADTFETFGGTFDGIRKNNFLIVGKTYKLTIEGNTTSSGFNIGDANASGDEYGSNFGTFYFTAVGGGSLWLRQNTAGVTNITNISIVEVTEDTNIPRLDYTGGGCPSLLLEPLSINLITHSEDFSDASWVKGSITATNGFYAPDGASGAYEIDFNSLNNFLFLDAAVTPSTEYNFSFYIKRGTATELKYRLIDVTNSSDIVSPTSYFSQTTSEWQRVDFSFTTPVGCTTLRAYPFSDTNSLGTVYLWGAQLEAQSYATSYIPTSGAIASRLADKVTGAGDATTFNSTEGVLYFEGSALANDGTNRSISINDGTTDNRVSIVFGGGANEIRGQVISSGTSFDFTTTSYNVLNNNKIAISYKLNDFSMWVNGTKVSTDTSGNTPSGMNVINFNAGETVLPFFGKVKDLRTYNTALTDLELIELTTI